MIDNLVLETTTSTGTGNLILSPVLRSCASAFGTGSSNLFYYGVSNDDGSEYEVGYTYMSDSTTLVRGGNQIVIRSSNSNNPVNFSAGEKKVVNDVPASLQRPGAIPVVSKSEAYTLTLNDSGKTILHPSADTTARIFTIPANSSVGFPIGTAVTFVNQNSGGVITIQITSDTMRLAGTGATGSRTLAANGVATALKITSTEWIISGTGLT